MVEQIVFTGGGSGGHVVPALSLIHYFKQSSGSPLSILYIGGKNGIEKKLVTEKNILFLGIETGKLRRYFSFKNFVDVFRILIGCLQSFWIILNKTNKRCVIISTGGFVSIPVVVAAYLLGRKIYLHEQTARVGLANKIASFFAVKIFISFEDSRQFFPTAKVVYSGYPLREAVFSTGKSTLIISQQELNIKDNILFVTGGGNGSELINQFIIKNISFLSEKYYIVHQVGLAHIDKYHQYLSSHYLPVAFLGDEIIDLFKMAKVVISRSGAGTVSELLALSMPSLFIPLKIAQKNEQYHNAKEANKLIGSMIIEEDDLKSCDLKQSLISLERIIENHTDKNEGTANFACKIILDTISEE